MRLASGLLPSENLAEQLTLAELVARRDQPVDSGHARDLAALVIEYQEYRGWDFRKQTISDMMRQGNGD